MSVDRSSKNRVAGPSLATVIEQRYSCRAFLPEPLPHSLIERMFELARQSPSWCNTQPWHAYVTEGNATDQLRSKLANGLGESIGIDPDIGMPATYEGAHLERRRESGWQLYEAVGVPKGDRQASARQAAKNFELFGAPHAAVITVDSALGAYGVLDVGIFIGHLLLAAESLGVAAVAQAAIAMRSSTVREFFSIPKEESVLLGISFGRADLQHPTNSYRTNRADATSVVRWRA
ncbi:nitroreductase [Gordonia rubripertincta]|uniref:Nitroreductase n=1 Tax=Gordonia rubripertincta TaxID=36822 RepID=A0ABT4MYC9_GORRU|nr:nitroreductase [Gordonia rubripertincta]MCZ4551051.1 nitroreductase [Gordonia rubripertincta]